MTGSRIEDYALLGDLHTAALVGRDGSVDWLCLPVFDSPSVFAALIGGPGAGRWSVRPQGAEVCSSRRYRPDTLVLETRWRTSDGTVDVIDLMPRRTGAPCLVRTVVGVTGRVTVESDLRAAFGYAEDRSVVELDGRRASFRSSEDGLVLWSPVPLERSADGVRAQVTVGAGERASFVLRHHDLDDAPPPEPDPDHLLADTESAWSDWMRDCGYRGRWESQVRRSLVLLKALTYAPTGGIVAAATTSLPEDLGGQRNWDYRYSWLRDSTFTLQSLLSAGFHDEARAWREWLVRAVAGDPADLQIMYGVDGRRRVTETELDHLPGYAGSRPVRIGNAAAGQLQLDVYGEVLDALHLARESGLQVVEDAWDLQRRLLDWLEGNWQEADSGLWEMRGKPREFVHSKVMAWTGVDRAVRSVEQHGLDGPADQWRRLRDRIHRDVCERGFDADRGTFTQSYGSTDLDAALLLIPRTGFLPWDDPRVRGTVEAVRRELSRDGFVWRYRQDSDEVDDGLSGGEGAFVACSFWLADALSGIGRTDEAVDVFRRMLDVRNDVGMLSEEYDPVRRVHLGNTPQAFSLVGLVNTARHLSTAVHPTSQAPPVPSAC
ncbi:MAG TPA: glycoside hydrolase family 15 protein [Nocardioides sp.]|nr:glycoside hydrolase family 15 protein [Nocardioides sp.]